MVPPKPLYDTEDQEQSPPMLPETPDLDEALPTDPGSALEHVRNAWLHLKVVDHVDAWREGAYAWDPSEYAPIPVETDGETTIVFAKT